MRSKVGIAETVSSALTDASITFAVIHGLEGYPSSLGRDIDILLHTKAIPRAIETVRSALKKIQCRLFACRRLNGDFWCFVDVFEKHTIFEFDLISMLRWGPCILHSEAHPDGMCGPFPIDSLASFTKSVLLPLLGGDPLKATQRMSEFSEVDNRIQRCVVDFLSEKFGKKPATLLWRSLLKRNSDELTHLVPQLKFRLMRQGLWAGPIPLFAATRHWIMNELGLTALGTPIAPSIAFVGPDGVGKSTIIDLVTKEVRQALPFNTTHLRHWRPQLIPPLAKFIGKPIPRAGLANPPRRKVGHFAVLRLIYYAFDFILGSCFKDKPRRAFNELIIYDRCALDMLVDPLRFGLPDARGSECLYKISPKHDLVILLKDTPERIFSRKSELSLTEIENQFNEWNRLYHEKKIHAVVNVGCGPETATKIVISLIHKATVQRLGLAEQKV